MKLGKHKAFRQLQIKRADARHRAAQYYYRIKKPLKRIHKIEAQLELLTQDYALIEQKREWNHHTHFEQKFKPLAAAKLARITALESELHKLSESIKEDYHLWNALRAHY